uniref:UPAR/Ly6 domain-containing protein n=1 Tax=Ciona savignyi TaxID=51511 RepID=H2ZQL2_CIOSA
MNVLTSVFFVLVIGVLKGEALDCYQCSLVSSNACNTEALSPLNLQNCAGGEQYCATTTIYINNSIFGSSTTTTRTCSAVPQAQSCVNLFGVITCTAATCNSNGCNGNTVPNTYSGALKNKSWLSITLLAILLPLVQYM